MENNNDFMDMDYLKKENPPSIKEEKVKRGYFYSGLVVGLASALLIVCVVFLSTRIQAFLTPTEQKVEIGNAGSILTEEMAEKIYTLEDIISKYFYLDEVTQEALEDGVYRGMLESLDDPYSVYYSQEELARLMDQTEGIYYGIGAYIGTDEDSTLPKISGIISGTPAEEAGLRTDDIIYEVDGESTYGYTLDEVVSKIKGEEGTGVTLTIVREGEADVLQVDVVRRRVESPTVVFEMLEDNTAYIRITEFDTVTTDQFTEALAMARGSGMTGLIIDLRGNPGGNLSTVVEIARKILPEGLIVYTEDKYGRRMEYTCDGSSTLEVPLVVLINGNSASASEILAGAIQDYGSGTLVGTTTFGKGIVQQIVSMEDGSAVKLTVSGYYTPKGNNIHGIGIQPDVECVFDVDAYYAEESYDNQLEKAKEVLSEMK